MMVAYTWRRQRDLMCLLFCVGLVLATRFGSWNPLGGLHLGFSRNSEDELAPSQPYVDQAEAMALALAKRASPSDGWFDLREGLMRVGRGRWASPASGADGPDWLPAEELQLAVLGLGGTAVAQLDSEDVGVALYGSAEASALAAGEGAALLGQACSMLSTPFQQCASSKAYMAEAFVHDQRSGSGSGSGSGSSRPAEAQLAPIRAALEALGKGSHVVASFGDEGQTDIAAAMACDALRSGYRALDVNKDARCAWQRPARPGDWWLRLCLLKPSNTPITPAGGVGSSQEEAGAKPEETPEEEAGKKPGEKPGEPGDEGDNNDNNGGVVQIWHKRRRFLDPADFRTVAADGVALVFLGYGEAYQDNDGSDDGSHGDGSRSGAKAVAAAEAGKEAETTAEATAEAEARTKTKGEAQPGLEFRSRRAFEEDTVRVLGELRRQQERSPFTVVVRSTVPSHFDAPGGQRDWGDLSGNAEDPRTHKEKGKDKDKEKGKKGKSKAKDKFRDEVKGKGKGQGQGNGSSQTKACRSDASVDWRDADTGNAWRQRAWEKALRALPPASVTMPMGPSTPVLLSVDFLAAKVGLHPGLVCETGSPTSTSASATASATATATAADANARACKLRMDCERVCWSPSIYGPMYDALEAIVTHERSLRWAWSAEEGVGMRLVHFVLLYPRVKASALCAAESALKALSAFGHADWTVVLWVQHVDAFERNHGALLAHLRAAHDARLVVRSTRFQDMIADTPLQDFYLGQGRAQAGTQAGTEASGGRSSNGSLGDFDFGEFAAQNRANALRLAIVYKYGGLYADSDIVIRGDPTRLREGAGLESGTEVNNAAFRFLAPRDPAVWLLMSDFVAQYRGSRWGWQGPGLFTRTLRPHPHYKFGPAMAARLRALQLWPKEAVSVLPWTRAADYLAERFPDDVVVDASMHSIAFHLWHKIVSPLKAAACVAGPGDYVQDTVVGRLRHKFCPRTLDVVVRDPTSLDYCNF